MEEEAYASGTNFKPRKKIAKPAELESVKLNSVSTHGGVSVDIDTLCGSIGALPKMLERQDDENDDDAVIMQQLHNKNIKVRRHN